jgi:hypothetical protein
LLLRSPVIYSLSINPMPEYHTHEWRVRREWVDGEGRLLRHRTCKGCSLEQQVRFVFSEMIWTLFRQWDKQNQGPVFDRRRPEVVRVIS